MTEPKRFLILDEDPQLCLVVADLCESMGCEVVYTGEPDIFRDYCLRFSPDGVALDLELPAAGTDGLELLRFLAEIGSPAEILLLTAVSGDAVASAERLARTLELRMHGVLNKPVDRSALEQMLRVMLGEPLDG